MKKLLFKFVLLSVIVLSTITLPTGGDDDDDFPIDWSCNPYNGEEIF